MDSRLDILGSAPDGENPAGGGAVIDDAREARRRERLDRLDEMAGMVQDAARGISQYIGGELDEEAARPFANIADPCASLTGLARAARQIFALQERADDAAEARARRLADEAAGRRKAERDAEAEREAADKAEDVAQKKRMVRRAITEVNHELGPGKGLPRPDRDRLLDDLFSDYERYEDFDRDVLDIMNDLEREAELVVTRPQAAPDPFILNHNKLTLAIQRRLLRMMGETAFDENGVDGAGSDGAGSDGTGAEPEKPRSNARKRGRGPP